MENPNAKNTIRIKPFPGICLLCLIWTLSVVGKSMNPGKTQDSIQKQEQLITSLYQDNDDNVAERLKAYFKGLKHNSKVPYLPKEFNIMAHNALSKYWHNKGNGDSALVYAQAAERLLGEGPPSKSWVTAMVNSSKAYFLQSKHKKSVEAATRALDISEELGYTEGIIEACNSMGRNYWILLDFDNAKKYYEKALQMAQVQEGFELNRGMLLGNLALIARYKGELEESKALHLASLELFEKIGNLYHLTIGLQNFATLLEDMDDYEGAISVTKQAIRHNVSLGNKRGLADTHHNVANNYYLKKDFQSAKKHLDTALKLAKEINYSFGKKEIYHLYSLIYGDEGNFKMALESHMNYAQWKDSISLDKQQIKVKELEKKYLDEESKNQILELTKENLLKEKDILKKDRTIRTVLIVGIIILLLLSAGFFVYKYRSGLFRQRAIFKTMVQTEIKEQHRIARDLHDSIGTMLATLKGQLSLIDPQRPQSRQALEKASGILDRTIGETRRISHNMMPEELVKFGLGSAVQSMLDDIKTSKNISSDFDCSIEENEIDMSMKLHLYRIIQELIQNVIKHSDSDVLTIRILKLNHIISLWVRDEGKGFNNAHFEDGYGLKNIQSRLNFLKGKWNILSEPSMGTTVSLKIPMND